MQSIEQKLTSALSGAAPGEYTPSVGSWLDRTTWIATAVNPEEQQAVNAVLATFDPLAPTADDVRAAAGRRTQTCVGRAMRPTCRRSSRTGSARRSS